MVHGGFINFGNRAFNRVDYGVSRMVQRCKNPALAQIVTYIWNQVNP